MLTSGESVTYHGVNYTLRNNEDPLGGLKVVPYQSMSIGSSFRAESLPEEYTKITLTPYGGVFIERVRKQS